MEINIEKSREQLREQETQRAWRERGLILGEQKYVPATDSLEPFRGDIPHSEPDRSQHEA